MAAISLARRVGRTTSSPIAAAQRRAVSLRVAGADIIDLTLGEPNFDTPDYIKTAGKAAIDDGLTKYTATPGTDELRGAVALSLLHNNGVKYDASEIIVSNGAKQILYLALAALVNDGDEVVIPTPYFPSYPEIVNILGGKSVFVDGDEANNFKIGAEALLGVITSKTKALILNSPNNPGGGVYTVAELRKLSKALSEHPQIAVLSDEIYQHVAFEDEVPSWTAAAPEMRARSIIVHGVSKTYAMTGWRIGYAAGPKPIISAMATLQSHMSSAPSTISQAASAAALRGDQVFLKEWRDIYRQKRDVGVALLNEITDIRCSSPDGAFYLFANCGGILGRRAISGKVILTDSDFADYLLDHVGVAVVAGVAYGRSPFFRISVAASLNEIDEGCRRIRKAVHELQR